MSMVAFYINYWQCIILYHLDNDYSGVPTVIPFVPPSQMSCFNITFPGDTEYEFHEAIKVTINSSGSSLNPGTITEADVVITDDDSKI